jgi:hypothetical protein
MSLGAVRPAPDVFSPSGATSKLRSDSSVGPSRLPRHHALGGAARVEITIVDLNSEGVGELCAGQQRTGINGRRNFVDGHRKASLLVSRRKRKSRRRA